MECLKEKVIANTKGTFRDTGLLLGRVVKILGSEYPTSYDSKVVFYYFKVPTGEEYYICDFCAYDEDSSSTYSPYSNYTK